MGINNKKELANISHPRYLLYPPMWIYRIMLSIPIIAFLAALPWLYDTYRSEEMTFWHWFFGSFLALLAIAAVRPKSWDWRELINMAATKKGIYFLVDLDEVVLVRWKNIGTIKSGDVRSGGKVIKGITIEVKTEDPRLQKRSGNIPFLHGEPEPGDFTEVGISSNFRSPDTITRELEKLRKSKG